MAEKYIISQAAAIRADVVYAAGIPEDIDSTPSTTRLYQYVRGTWDAIDVPIGTYHIMRYDRPEGGRIAVYVSPYGRLFSPEPSFAQEDIIDRSLAATKKLGQIFDCRQLGSDLIACGSGGQNYRKPLGGRWAPLDLALFNDEVDQNWVFELQAPGATMGEQDAWWRKHPKERAETDRRLALSAASLSFYAIDGQDTRNIYMCSADGKIYFYDGDRARQLKSPVSSFLNGILVEDEETVWIRGHDGTLLRGNARTGFAAVPCDGRPHFNGIARFQGRLYLSSFSSPKGVFVYDGTLRQVSSGLRRDLTDVTMVDAVEDMLWVFGLRDMARFDGKTWERIQVPN